MSRLVSIPQRGRALLWRRNFVELVQSRDPDFVINEVQSIAPRCIDPDFLDQLKHSLPEIIGQEFDGSIDVFGSGRLGFSLSPKKFFQSKVFSRLSDIDIVVISRPIFDQIQHSHYIELSYKGKWMERSQDDDFYAARGWLREDKHSRARIFSRPVKQFAEGLLQRRYSCSIALFRSQESHFSYLLNGLNAIKTRLRVEGS